MTNPTREKMDSFGGLYDEDEQNMDETSKKYLTFFADDQGFAIDSDYVIEIINEFSITHLPCVPDFIKGIINLRGQIIPIMDMRLRLGRTEAERTRYSCIVVIAVHSISIGLFVDRVSQMIDLDLDQISPTPENHQDEFVDGISRVDRDVYLMVDCNRLIINMD